MTVTILHISDLHFGDSQAVLNRQQVSDVMKNLLAKAGVEVMLVMSGDISFKGQKSGYIEASSAFLPVLNHAAIQKNRIIVCPGNHDICKSNVRISQFEAFDAWSAGLRKDKRCTFSDTSCRYISCQQADFLVINSAYHGDTEYGLVDLESLDSALIEMETAGVNGAPRIAVLHHHLIPFSGRDDKSTTRNAHQVLTRLVKYGFSLVLHGHQHALLELGLGSNLMKLYGVGSFRYNTPGFINGASLYRINELHQVTTERYAISMDATDFLRPFKD
jgi:3',5'-cyclic AMP phosphodiesterase CpdA